MPRSMPLDAEVWRAVVVLKYANGTERTEVYGPYSRRQAAVMQLNYYRAFANEPSPSSWRPTVLETRLERAGAWEVVDG